MLPELTKFVPATRMGIVKKSAFRSWKPCRTHFFTFSQCFSMALTLQNLKLGGNLEFSWYSCNILRYCSNRCIVWFFIPENYPAQANRKFPVQLYVKIQILFEPPFWICKWANHLSFLAMPRSGQTKDYKIGICCFSAKHAPFRRKRKAWLGRNQVNISEWSDMSTLGLLLQWASTIKIQLNVLV
jgi:hypothetical protein